jgi:hypothetical protein
LNWLEVAFIISQRSLFPIYKLFHHFKGTGLWLDTQIAKPYFKHYIKGAFWGKIQYLLAYLDNFAAQTNPNRNR